MNNRDLKNNVLKVDLDLRFKFLSVNQLKERLNFMHYLKIIDKNDIKEIILIKKSKYSCKIIMNKKTKNENLLILQAILGDDYKRIAINFRDLFVDNRYYWNKLFDVKRYPDGKFKQSKFYDVTKEVLN